MEASAEEQKSAQQQSSFASLLQLGKPDASPTSTESATDAVAPAAAAAKAATPRALKGKKEKLIDFSSASSKLAIEEGLKLTDANGLAMKTPVSILQEILSRRGITPNYELVQIEGAIHEPTFRYRVSFNDKDSAFTAMGAGRSKKEAKHSAARALIDKLSGGQLGDVQDSIASPNISSSSAGNENGTSITNAESADTIIGNPIGKLQELCMAQRWPPPNYETETEVGLPHERQFTIACSILDFREVGKGKSKKIAKRLAAHKMWTRMQENPLDASKINDSMWSELKGENRNYASCGDLKNINVPILTSHHSSKVSQFHKALKNATGQNLLKLQKTCLKAPNIDFIAMLADIAIENQFEVTYVDIEERAYNGNYQCLVQLSTLPVGVCHGSGETAADAQRESARNALEYLKIMTKKCK